MSYIKTTWADDTTPISAEKMNKIEQIAFDNDARFTTMLATNPEVKAGTNAVKVVTPAALRSLTIGTASSSSNLRYSSDAEVAFSSPSWTKKKSCLIKSTGIYRIGYSMRTASGRPSNTNIYKNNAAVGTERNISSTITEVAYSEDLAFSAGDTCEIWASLPAGDETSYVKLFRLSFDITSQLIFDVTTEIPTLVL